MTSKGSPGDKRRKPTTVERKEIALAAHQYVNHYRAQEPDTAIYDLAFRGLSKVHWLHAQSRDGIAAAVARYWPKQPYAEFSDDDLAALEEFRQHQRRQAAIRNVTNPIER